MPFGRFNRKVVLMLKSIYSGATLLGVGPILPLPPTSVFLAKILSISVLSSMGRDDDRNYLIGL